MVEITVVVTTALLAVMLTYFIARYPYDALAYSGFVFGGLFGVWLLHSQDITGPGSIPVVLVPMIFGAVITMDISYRLMFGKSFFA